MLLEKVALLPRACWRATDLHSKQLSSPSAAPHRCALGGLETCCWITNVTFSLRVTPVRCSRITRKSSSLLLPPCEETTCCYDILDLGSLVTCSATSAASVAVPPLGASNFLFRVAPASPDAAVRGPMESSNILGTLDVRWRSLIGHVGRCGTSTQRPRS